MPDELDRINAAVRECLSRCMPATNSTNEILFYLKGLRAQGWTESEVTLVRATVTRFLREMAEDVNILARNDIPPPVTE